MHFTADAALLGPQGFEKTGLGERVATLFVKAFGKSTLGLAYGLGFAEALIAPAMPSTTARAGGIFMPIMSSLSQNAGSLPGLPTAYSVKQLSSLRDKVCSSAMLLKLTPKSLIPSLLLSLVVKLASHVVLAACMYVLKEPHMYFVRCVSELCLWNAARHRTET